MYLLVTTTSFKPMYTHTVLPVAVVVKFIITGICDENSKSCPQGVEYLSCSINPDLHQNVPG